jgi:Na+-transporting methylmalonyl-CoA/oxaloacetate decarboxylase beta subunit
MHAYTEHGLPVDVKSRHLDVYLKTAYANGRWEPQTTLALQHAALAQVLLTMSIFLGVGTRVDFSNIINNLSREQIWGQSI